MFVWCVILNRRRSNTGWFHGRMAQHDHRRAYWCSEGVAKFRFVTNLSVNAMKMQKWHTHTHTPAFFWRCSGWTSCAQLWPGTSSHHVSRGRCGDWESTYLGKSSSGVSRGRSPNRGPMHYETCHTRDVDPRHRLLAILSLSYAKFVPVFSLFHHEYTTHGMRTWRHDRSCCRKFAFLVRR